MVQRKKFIIKNAFITGAAGFLGSHLVEELVKEKYSVTALVKENEDCSFIKKYKINIIKGDILKIDFNKKIKQGSYIFHCASLTPGYKAPKEAYIDINVNGTKNLIEACIKRKAKQFIYISSGSAVGPVGKMNKPIKETSTPMPDTYYGQSKLAAEQLLKKYSDKIQIIIIRPSVIFGPRMPKISAGNKLFRFAKNKYIPVVSRGIFEICYIKNIINMVILIHKKCRKKYDIYNAGEEEKYNFKEIITKINPKARTISIPYIILKIVAVAGNILFKNKFNTRILNGMVGSWNTSIKKAEEEFKFKPKFSIQEGINQTLKYKNN